jgi:class 3 adenylate cyclase
MERRLAAILAADVVGYSRLMEQDEAGTFTRLRAHRKELFEPEIAAHHGHVFGIGRLCIAVTSSSSVQFRCSSISPTISSAYFSSAERLLPDGLASIVPSFRHA